VRRIHFGTYFSVLCVEALHIYAHARVYMHPHTSTHSLPFLHIYVQERGIIDGSCRLVGGAEGAKKLTLECKNCKAVGDETTGLSRRMPQADTPEFCCMKRALYTQPDFRDDVNRDPTILTLLKQEGQFCLFLPKYHYEFNFIEMYWGACKRVLRKENSGKCPISLPVAACMCAVVAILWRANIYDFWLLYFFIRL
jgi:hypothetical protein